MSPDDKGEDPQAIPVPSGAGWDWPQLHHVTELMIISSHVVMIFRTYRSTLAFWSLVRK